MAQNFEKEICKELNYCSSIAETWWFSFLEWIGESKGLILKSWAFSLKQWVQHKVLGRWMDGELLSKGVIPYTFRNNKEKPYLSCLGV
jgi:hypothetical protein